MDVISAWALIKAPPRAIPFRGQERERDGEGSRVLWSGLCQKWRQDEPYMGDTRPGPARVGQRVALEFLHQ